MSNLFKERTRKLVEENISAALSTLKSRARAVKGVAPVVEELDKILTFSNLLNTLKNHPDAERFAPRVGRVSLLGGNYDTDRKVEDLKLLYRAYVTDSLPDGLMEDDKLAALNQLAQAVTGGELEIADSKAEFLQNLCDELHFDPQKASETHEEIYRQKLQQCMADGELSEEDVAALLRLRVMLCVSQQTVEAAHSDICGSLFEKVVRDAITSGVDGYDADVKQSVRKAAHGLRLTREIAMSIASKAVRKIFINYIKRARTTGKIKSLQRRRSNMPEEVDEDEEWNSILRPNKELEAKLGKPGQTDITLKDDLPERDRTDLYKTYLLFCLTGEVKKIPFGAQITTKKDDSEYVLLNQLGSILGLTSKEIVEVHRSLAEQAFRQQAEVILADGQLTEARVEQLNNLQKQVGLPPQYAQKIIKSITTTKVAAAIKTAVSQGRLSIKQIRELKESSVDIDSMVSENLRETLFKKIVENIFSSGTGEEIVKEWFPLNDLLACDKAVPSRSLSWEVPEELADLYSVYQKSDPGPDKLSHLQYLLGITDSTAAALREMGDRLLPIGAEEENFVF
ncbi:TIC110 protein, chloroplastic [Quillaja saponaria]|uniref:TIC110 protein, chloroplastic n=1 Tax=Quillaja saponaria TaxID=32244 RepID=A0AAD7LKN1_QUISA|nr:TIC110 protein, chloroplastic [Quillaja saponaria]